MNIVNLPGILHTRIYLWCMNTAQWDVPRKEINNICIRSINHEATQYVIYFRPLVTFVIVLNILSLLFLEHLQVIISY